MRESTPESSGNSNNVPRQPGDPAARNAGIMYRSLPPTFQERLYPGCVL